MQFIDRLHQTLDEKHLLKHEYYQKWNEGSLPLDSLKTYARQYYQHVKAFPRYISATHSQCQDINARQVLLRNLNDEEAGEKHHPQLWLDFACGLGQDVDAVENEALLPETQNIIDTFMQFANSSYAEGLGALYAYERQIPEIAQTKIDGLKKFYGVEDKKTLEFFEVHREADVWHAQECAQLIEQLSDADKEKALAAAEQAATALWGFLDGMYRETLH